eukprot:5581282-Lingulodinium_polyedra.AAC.1
MDLAHACPARAATKYRGSAGPARPPAAPALCDRARNVCGLRNRRPWAPGQLPPRTAPRRRTGPLPPR